MSKIFELYGYRLDRWNDEAARNSKRAHCPFMDAECDGGGNRYSSALNAKSSPRLANYFTGKSVAQAGICSIRLNEHDQPWVVCPRRLLSLRGEKSARQTLARRQLIDCSRLVRGKRYRAWSEVRMKIGTQTDDGADKSFDYTFDYIIAGAAPKKLSDAAKLMRRGAVATQTIAEGAGYTLSRRGDEVWVDDFPADPIVIVEVMTSSTSGGNKKNRSQIAMACEDALVGARGHNAPGINYRQVWARMVSQLIVKSQVGNAWGGQTFWLIQDVLGKYISSTTALDLSRLIADRANEVNILSFGYGDIDQATSAPIAEISKVVLHAGPITPIAAESEEKGFVDIVKISATPAKEHLWRSLFRKQPSGSIAWA